MRGVELPGELLDMHNLVELTNVDQAYEILIGGKVQAIVFDAPTLLYWAAKRGPGLVQVIGPVFRPQMCGIAVVSGSPLRKRINATLEDMSPTAATRTFIGSGFLKRNSYQGRRVGAAIQPGLEPASDEQGARQ